ncbi:MAG: site-specific DNA-methyltransferase [Xanthobacteraceae bacterium]
MLYRPPKQAKRAPKTRQRKTSVRLECLDAFDFLSKLDPGSVDLIVSSPPYCMGKSYDKSDNVQDFIADHQRLAPLLVRALKDGGSLCWQVGHHVNNGVVIPLDALVYQIFSKQKGLFLRNRIVWTFGHGVHASRRFSGRHETILWFTKGQNYEFNLDAVRVPQKYPGKRHYKGPNKGQFSGNPLGKNPSDVWEIPNVKSRHVEKTVHPCQFPVALAQRLVRALTKSDSLVIDPFLGSGSSAVAAALEGRRFAGCDIDKTYVSIARKRLGTLHHRNLDKPIYQPRLTDAVAKTPPHFSIVKNSPLTTDPISASLKFAKRRM